MFTTERRPLGRSCDVTEVYLKITRSLATYKGLCSLMCSWQTARHLNLDHKGASNLEDAGYTRAFNRLNYDRDELETGRW